MEKLSNEQFRAIVDKMNQRYDDCLNNKNPAGYRDLVTDKYTWVDELNPITVRGKDAVVELGTSWVEAGAKNERIVAEEVENYGNVGWQIAKINIDWPNGNGGHDPLEGRFVEIFERQEDGEWKTRLQFYLASH
ncbi:YybH family protein [Sphingobium nicotianae]|uniref:DUF4440 domain-containing protein n=1 Tax=Sphingobium nicotianae TaxID=2782607 RepID=A0A9X1IPE8_9SPHN|nr:nuclear transport factor 2 family protein [Sphingobium nicotianae]MBT2186057.1 DUF4440 domain-containing protein [Sphingobium nicotianae]